MQSYLYVHDYIPQVCIIIQMGNIRVGSGKDRHSNLRKLTLEVHLQALVPGSMQCCVPLWEVSPEM